MSKDHLDPARSVIAKIGVDKVAEITGKHVSRVYRWMYPKEKGGTGGFIPPADAQVILAYAVSEGVPLSPAEFMVPAATIDTQQFDDLIDITRASTPEAAA
jgi:hypothetical protein